MTNKDLVTENNKFQRLMTMADLGWWEADFKKQLYTCSEFVVDLFGLNSNTISFSQFGELIREDYRTCILGELEVAKERGGFEQTFPVYSKSGEIWIRAKLSLEETETSGDLAMLGFLQCIESPEEEDTDKEAQHINNLHSYLLNFFKHMPVGYIRFGLIYQDNIPVDYVFLDTNETAAKVLKNTYTDFIGKKASELGLNVSSDIKMMTEVINTGKHKEHNYCTSGQGKYWRSVLYSPQKDEIISLFTDYTDTYIAHQALDKSEKILRNIYRNLPVGVELYDEDGYLVNINDKEIEIFGLESKEELLGLNLFDNPVIPNELKEKLRKQEDIDFSLNYDFTKLKDYLKSGSKRKFNLVTKATCLYDKQNNFLNYLFINIDNSETTNAYSRIQEFEEFFSVIADFATIGYYKWNPLTKEGFAITQWFKNLDESEDAKLEEVAGVYRNMHPDDREVLQDFYRKILTGEAKNIRKEIRIVLKDGSWRWLRCYITVNEYDPKNNIIEMIGVNYDITELKQVQEKLITAKNKAETLDRLKSAFLANMSHEIRTPLNAIVGFSNLLVDSDDMDERKQYISIVQENNDLLLQLISDILDLSKIEAGTFDFIKGYVDINLLCTEIVCSLGLKAPSHVQVVFEEYMPECYIYSDKNRLIQILTNFINNALKFTPNGTIALGYRRTKEDEIEFFVRDTGIGIPPEKAETIFDRFVKLNSFVQGTGLGLSICKSIVEQMGGDIGVESEVGVGSRFWFTHPYDKTLTYSRILEENLKTKTSDAMSRQAPVVTSDYKPTVLIAEDTDSNYLLISTILKKDYTLVRALNGVEAIDLFDKVNPEIILMDVKMPEMDGIEATIKIREKDKDIPIIAVTAFAFDRDRQRSINAGCNDYLFKPVSGYALKTLINKYICNK